MKLIIGVIVILLLAAFFAVLTCKSKNSDLFKWIGIVIFIAFCLTWILPTGQIVSGAFNEKGLVRLGLTDLSTVGYYAISYCITTLIYLLVLGGFYGVLSKSTGYKNLVNSFAKKIKKHELLISIITIIILVCLTSITSSTLALLVFIPFIITVFLNAGYNKMLVMLTTFGSLLSGTIAATYGTEGLYWFNYYLGTEATVGFTYRLIIAASTLILYVAFYILKYFTGKKKSGKDKSKEDAIEDDLFAIEQTKAKGKTWPTIVVLSLLAVLVILGFVNWSSYYKIECFNELHTWIGNLTIGKDLKIFSAILGSSAVAFGNFTVNTLTVLLLIFTLIISIIERISVKDYMASFGEGFSKMLKPTVLYVLTYCVFVVCYMSPIMAYVTDFAFGLTKNFNPFITSVVAFITSIFHTDIGYTGFAFGSVLTTTYANNVNIAHVLYTALYGVVQIFMPTSGLLLIGLSYLKIDYKSWFKYIWIFAVSIIAIILIVAAIAVY